MAHGDLQHGNVIVDESNSLRLVDLDGMYVPAMAGWKASELGHRHYQHPKRSADHFDAKLDNFSGLVIYLSLLALAEQPDLWKEFHDENLIFIKSDFENPRTSKLLGKIKAIVGDCRRLAEALGKACGEDPSRCPSALDLVSATPSKLPAWMVNSPAVTVQQATREVKAGQVPPPRVSSAVPLPSSTASSQPWYAAAPASVNVPYLTSPTKGAVSVPLASREVARHALTYAFLGIFLIWIWIPLLRYPFVGLGATSRAATWLATFSYLAVCMSLAYRRANREANPTASVSQTVSWTPTPPIPAPASRPAPIYSSRPVTSKVASSGASTVPKVLVGSKIRQIYHKPSCSWAMKISSRNRIQFSSDADAKGRGYRPCSVCSP
jgi:hypothetical protein